MILCEIRQTSKPNTACLPSLAEAKKIKLKVVENRMVVIRDWGGNRKMMAQYEASVRQEKCDFIFFEKR